MHLFSIEATTPWRLNMQMPGSHFMMTHLNESSASFSSQRQQYIFFLPVPMLSGCREGSWKQSMAWSR